MSGIRKIKAGLVTQTTINTFIGEVGNIFFNPDTGELRLSDGVTPGGIPLGGGGGGATIFRQLYDTPSTYVGSEGYFVKVKDDASGLEFVNQTLFSGDFDDLTNTPTTLAGYGITDAFSGDFDDLTNKPDTLSVGVVDTNDTLISNTTDVTAIRFDSDSGFDVVDLGSGIVKVQMNSTFKYWKSQGEDDLVATGLDTVEFIAGNGISISLDPNGSPYQTITITNTGGNGGGAVSLNDLTDVTYDVNTVAEGDRLAWDGEKWSPDPASSGPDLLGVIIDLTINEEGDLILTHIDTFVQDNVYINDNGEFILTDEI